MLVDLLTSEKVWAVLRSKPRKEEFLSSFLKSEGFECYLPMVAEKCGKTQARPLFPGYMFAKISPRFELAAIKDYPNVLCPLIFSGQLAVLENNIIKSFKAETGASGVIVLERPPRFRKGDAVRITQGSFAGIKAVVTEYLPERERVRLLLDYFGREVSLEADEALLA